MLRRFVNRRKIQRFVAILKTAAKKPPLKTCISVVTIQGLVENSKLRRVVGKVIFNFLDALKIL